MRNSNSKEKNSTSVYSQNAASKLLKTQGPPKIPPKQNLNNTQYKASTSNKQIQQPKVKAATRPLPRQQIDFDIENNMTQSKIFVAKQSLQLLKKKMNRTGMSRQKPSNTQTIKPVAYQAQSSSMKKIKSQTNKNLNSYQPNKNSYQASKYQVAKQQYHQMPSSKMQKKPVEKAQKKPAAQRKVSPPPQQAYYDQRQDIPIAKGQDFFALLEKQIQKEQNKNITNGSNILKGKQQSTNNNMMDQYGGDIELFQCGKGCGRKFNANVLPKHQKVCVKVFQTQRKVFNVDRLPQVEGFQKPQPNKMNQTKKPEKPQAKGKVPKWKLQSAQLRAGLKMGKDEPLTKQQKQMQQMQNDAMIQCSYCGRKFNQQAGKRHIAFCETKNKKMPAQRPSVPAKKR